MAAKVSLSFAKLADTELDNFAQGVIDAMTGNAAFPTRPSPWPTCKRRKLISRPSWRPLRLVAWPTRPPRTTRARH